MDEGMLRLRGIPFAAFTPRPPRAPHLKSGRSPGFRSDLARSFRLAYAAGLVLCVVGPLLLQLLLGGLGPDRPGAPGLRDPLVEQLGYTFTGLTCACALALRWRWRRTRSGFRALPVPLRGRVMIREILFYSALCAFSALAGLLFYGLGGLERFARGFIALTVLMFFSFVPRLATWRAAAGEE